MRVLRGVLVQSLDQQDDRSDMGPLDPAKIAFHPDEEYPVTIGFDAKLLIGKGKLSRREDGAIMIETTLDENGAAKLDEYEKPFRLAIGVMQRDAGYRPYEASIVKKHADHNQPEAEVVEA